MLISCIFKYVFPQFRSRSLHLKERFFQIFLSLFIHLQGDFKEIRTIPIVHLIGWLVNVPHVVMMLSSPMLEMLVKILGQVQTHITPTYFLTSHCCSFLRQVFNQSETRTVSDMRELTNQSGGWWWSAADSVLHCCSVRGGEEGAGGSLVARLFSQSIPETEDDSAPIYT